MTKKNNKKGTRARHGRKRGSIGARSSELTRARQSPSGYEIQIFGSEAG